MLVNLAISEHQRSCHADIQLSYSQLRPFTSYTSVLTPIYGMITSFKKKHTLTGKVAETTMLLTINNYAANHQLIVIRSIDNGHQWNRIIITIYYCLHRLFHFVSSPSHLE